jgi:hypothetical protein
VVGTLPQYALESSIANNFGVGFEHGPQRASILLQIVRLGAGTHRPQIDIKAPDAKIGFPLPKEAGLKKTMALSLCLIMPSLLSQQVRPY